MACSTPAGSTAMVTATAKAASRVLITSFQRTPCAAVTSDPKLSALSVGGILGSSLLAAAKPWAPLFLGLAILPATGALFLPGLMLIVAVLLALSEPEPGARRMG